MVNNCNFVGRLGNDPKTGTFKGKTGDSTWTSFSVAVDKSGPKTQDSKPLWLSVSTFGKPADACAKYLKKGSLVYVQGEVDLEEYTPKDQPGTTRQTLKLNAHTVKFLDPKKADGEASATGAPAGKTASAGADEDIPF